MALVQPFALVNSTNVKWTSTQEKSINRDYPFTNLHLESPEQYVVRTYLQFLWLPESIMPLTLLVPSLRRVQEPPSSSPGSEHPLHAMLEPLLLSTRTSSTKYHTELPQILANSGGEGEIEETTMWYALNYEKVGAGEEEGERKGENGVQGGNSEDSIMMEEKWKNAWLERLERREVQIQILLYLLKLSLPGPCRPLPPVTIPPLETGNDSKLAKSSKRRKEKPITVTPSPAERLESFMDKLSTWQLISRMDDTQGVLGTFPRERDWMQAFCEDVVEAQFKVALPDMCKILRSKLFPRSPFADDDESEADASDLSSSPVPSSKPLTSKPSKKEKKRERSKQDRNGSVSVSSTAAGLGLRARSRSLSVSLAQDASTRRSNSSTSTTLKRALSREVSMSRTFKPRPAAPLKGPEDPKMVHSQPQDPSHRLAPDARKRERNMQGVTLVAATPTKLGLSKRRRSVGAGERRTRSPSPILNMDTDNRDMDPFEARDEEIWLPDSSPNLVLLQPHEHSSSSSSCLSIFNNQNDDDSDMEIQTPVKKRVRL
ncbi:hypothetical protein EDD16DRAFT_1854115 [Pisolithus croceorrhizus]|nr:hypothetical protein EDD16DRAFT_1854115 [Pisolithus croceorrhizus]KAI6129962.1 hypothetical protein EV401DRAFT_2206070 [Pisolithus croceorrhizus]KAI6166577.1 hypothetical protein EDD17DRAFT_1544369 [Pisolithus thermaeus]